jgi:hypothetical protein
MEEAAERVEGGTCRVHQLQSPQASDLVDKGHCGDGYVVLCGVMWCYVVL